MKMEIHPIENGLVPVKSWSSSLIRNQLSINCFPRAPINNSSILVQAMAWHQMDTRPFSETMTALTHMCLQALQCVTTKKQCFDLKAITFILHKDQCWFNLTGHIFLCTLKKIDSTHVISGFMVQSWWPHTHHLDLLSMVESVVMGQLLRGNIFTNLAHDVNVSGRAHVWTGRSSRFSFMRWSTQIESHKTPRVVAIYRRILWMIILCCCHIFFIHQLKLRRQNQPEISALQGLFHSRILA